jgi:hypothetical protein
MTRPKCKKIDRMAGQESTCVQIDLSEYRVRVFCVNEKKWDVNNSSGSGHVNQL